MFIRAFTKARHLILSRTRAVRDSPSHVLKIRFNIISLSPRPSETIRDIVDFYGEEL